MRVKIGDKWFDSENEPIMIELLPDEKTLIGNMSPVDMRFCAYNKKHSPEEIMEWMNEKE